MRVCMHACVHACMHVCKTLILSDSILGRIQMKNFNEKLNNGRAYRKYFPGATPKDIADYCVTTIRNHKPDSVVIHMGSNSLYNDDINEIAEDIFNVIQICRNYGVNEVFLSGITFRNRHKLEI